MTQQIAQPAQPLPFAGRHAAQAAAIPELARQEVVPMARAELDRFLALVETLTPDDLRQPTDCALWTVKDVIAHQASHVIGFTRFVEFFDQFSPLSNRAYTAKGLNMLDAANQRQVDLRTDHTLEQLVAEMRDHAERSLKGRDHFAAPLRWMPVPVPGFGSISLAALIDIIYTRDMWMHRADICRATGRDMIQTAEHDGRVVALIVRDADARLRRKLGDRTVLLHLTGTAGGAWTVGGDGEIGARLKLDVLEFNRLASGRISMGQALDGGLVEIEGDQALGRVALENTVVLY